MANLTESDDWLIAIYHCDHMQFMAICDDGMLDRMDYLNETLPDAEISKCIERYNLRHFGVTHKDCKQGKCFLCKDFSKCDKVK